MNVLHDSRLSAYRSPFGAVEAGTKVTLALDVWDAPDALAAVRTWTTGEGERIYQMEQGAGPDGATRFQATLVPDAAEYLWYHFIITRADGSEQRYGTLPGRTGGKGQLGYGEPPSFQLTVFDAASADDAEPSSFNHANGLGFDEAISRYLLGSLSASELIATRETLLESCPAALLEHAFDLLGCDDRVELLMWLGGAVPVGEPVPAELEFPALDDSPRGLAKGRLWCASLIQALGLDAPRSPYADLVELWEAEDDDCGTIVRNASDMRAALPLFAGVGCQWFAANEDVLGIWRWDDSESACLLINRSLSCAYDTPVVLADEAVSEIIGGWHVPIIDTPAADAHAATIPEGLPAGRGDGTISAQAHLNQLGSAVLYFHPKRRLGQAMEPGLGVLAHITSLPSGEHPAPSTPEARSGGESEGQGSGQGVGTGEGEGAGEGSGESQGSDQGEGVGTGQGSGENENIKAAGRLGTLGAPARTFIDWMAEAGVRYWQVLPVNPTDEFGSPYAGISAFAGNTLLMEGNVATTADELAESEPEAYRAFCEKEAAWLEPYACFMAIRQNVGKGKVWQEWAKKYRTFDPALLRKDDKLRRSAESWRRAQFAFERQWREAREYANERGIRIIGDMPIYVSADSADVWAHPEIFQLESDGTPSAVAGCPPDPFATEGQIWGNPLYDWDVLRESGYSWWLRRLERALDLYDVVRLDHFIGFARYFSIPIGKKALEGTYRPGPGLDFFAKAHETFGPLPIIAEDLGSITPAVRALGAACGFPGMDIVQFVDGNDPLSGYRPRPEKIAYTGTHDNQTLRGYVASRYPDRDEGSATERLLEMVVACDADVCVVPLQDVLQLGDEARMNTPGTSGGNWAWQAEEDAVQQALDRAKHLVALNRPSRG